MIFVATRFQRDAMYGEEFEAVSWVKAKHICEENEWRLDGEHKFTISDDSMTIEKAHEIINALNEREDATSH